MKRVARLSIALLTLLLFALSVYALAGPGEAQEQSSTPDETAGADHTPGPPPSPTPMATGVIGVPSAPPEGVPACPPFPSTAAVRVEVLSGTGKDGCYDLDKNSRVRLETITTKGTCYVELPYIQPQEFMVNDAPLTLRGTPLEVDVGALH